MRMFFLCVAIVLAMAAGGCAGGPSGGDMSSPADGGDGGAY